MPEIKPRKIAAWMGTNSKWVCLLLYRGVSFFLLVGLSNSTACCPKLGTTSPNVVDVGNKYSWASSTSVAVVARHHRPLHSLCSA